MPISYTNKDKNSGDGITDKWRDVDANEVKTVVNTIETDLNTLETEVDNIGASTKPKEALVDFTATTVLDTSLAQLLYDDDFAGTVNITSITGLTETTRVNIAGGGQLSFASAIADDPDNEIFGDPATVNPYLVMTPKKDGGILITYINSISANTATEDFVTDITGDKTTLTTTDKTNLVNAINEVKGEVGGGGGEGDGTLVANVTIPAAQVATIFTSPVEVIAAPGVGKHISFLNATMWVDNTGNFWETNTNCYFFNGSTGNPHSGTVNAALNANASHRPQFHGTETRLIFDDTAAFFSVKNGDPTGSGGDVYLRIYYRIETTPIV